MSFTTCETIPFRPIIRGNEIHQYHVWGKLRDCMDPYKNCSNQFPTFRSVRTLFCGRSEVSSRIEQMCNTLGMPKVVEIPNYIVMKAYGNYYLFGYYRTQPLLRNTDNVLEFQWMPMSLVQSGASYYSSKDGEEVVYAERGLGVAFQIRQSTLTDLLKVTYDNQGDRVINLWGFERLPTVNEAVRQERTTRLLQFRMAKQVSECGTLVANAAIMGAPLEFKMRMYHFTKQKRWKLIPIKPRDGLLTDAQKAEEPKPLSHWIQRETCLKLHGDEGYHDMMNTLMDNAMV